MNSSSLVFAPKQTRNWKLARGRASVKPWFPYSFLALRMQWIFSSYFESSADASCCTGVKASVLHWILQTLWCGTWVQVIMPCSNVFVLTGLMMPSRMMIRSHTSSGHMFDVIICDNCWKNSVKIRSLWSAKFMCWTQGVWERGASTK